MGVRPLTCLCRVHSSVPAGPVSDPSCTRPRVVWCWTFPSGSPPVLSTTSNCLTTSLISCYLQFLPPPGSLCAVKTGTCLCHLHPRSAPSPHLPISLHLFLQTLHTASCVFMSSSPPASSSAPFCWASALLSQRPLSPGPSGHMAPVVPSPGRAASSLSSFFLNFVYFGCAGSPLLRERSLVARTLLHSRGFSGGVWAPGSGFSGCGIGV